jgi:hypothetical protein
MLGDMQTGQTADKRTWCVFRNLVHAVYREVRHLGPIGDREARVTVSTGALLSAAWQCKTNRAQLKSARLYKLIQQANTVSAVLNPYRERTGLDIDGVISIFRLPNWTRTYGGPKWARIATTLKDLIAALEDGDRKRAAEISATAFTLNHNSGPLIPSRSEWKQNNYLREKWPELCE